MLKLRGLSALLVFAGVVALAGVASIALGLGPNLGLPFGYYGKLNQVRRAVASIPGIEIVAVRLHRDVELEDFTFDLRVDSQDRSLPFSDTDQRSLDELMLQVAEFRRSVGR